MLQARRDVMRCNHFVAWVFIKKMLRECRARRFSARARSRRSPMGVRRRNHGEFRMQLRTLLLAGAAAMGLSAPAHAIPLTLDGVESAMRELT